jgi:hypothetical protein
MFVTTAVDVAIGLILTYLLLGLIISALQEIVATLLKLRGRYLFQGLALMLSVDGKADFGANSLFTRVTSHPMMQGPAPSIFGRIGPKSFHWPSYVSPDNFVRAVIDTLLVAESTASLFDQINEKIKQLPEGRAKESLRSIVRSAGGDIDKFRKQLTQWFNDAMDRVAGGYKRFSQAFTIIFGLILAIVINVDSLKISEALWQEPGARAEVVAAAQAWGTQQATLANAGKAAPSELAQLPIPLGWPNFATLSAKGEIGQALLGWLITGLAVSLGAPFWFDALQTFLNIRGTGPKPGDSAPAPQAQPAAPPS